MPLDFTDDTSTLVQVMAWCRQATRHYMSQCWPRFMSPYGVTRPQWVKVLRRRLSNMNAIQRRQQTKPNTSLTDKQTTEVLIAPKPCTDESLLLLIFNNFRYFWLSYNKYYAFVYSVVAPYPMTHICLIHKPLVSLLVHKTQCERTQYIYFSSSMFIKTHTSLLLCIDEQQNVNTQLNMQIDLVNKHTVYL